MGRNILVFADGTGNEGGLLPDESRTNVYKLFRATRTGPDSTIDPNKQIAFYVPGVGTPLPGQSGTWRHRWEQVQQMVGIGIAQKIVDCYIAIISVWQPGDRIYLFGFSRGAYTARCVAHVLELFGVPTKEPGSKTFSLEPAKLRKIARSAVNILYTFGLEVEASLRRQAQVDEFRRKYASQLGAEIGAVPYFVGVWDTVAAIGWARFIKKNYDRHFPVGIRFARHAMSIDEYRKDFARVPWGGSNLPRRREGEPEPFEQVWFAGNHSDIGGSYPENESRLSDITLQWMADFIENKLPPEGRVAIDRTSLNLYPASDGMMHDECMVPIGGTIAYWYPKDRDVPNEATLHESVYERLKMDTVRNYIGYGKYRPVPLRNHVKAKVYFVNLDPVSAPQRHS